MKGYVWTRRGETAVRHQHDAGPYDFEEVIKGAEKFGRDYFIPEAEIARLEKLDRKPGRPKKSAENQLI